MRKVALIIMDGWGLGEERENNAIHVAKTPFFDHIWNNYPHTALQASGEYVGLPEGQIGGSEVGHMTIGAGRVIYQELVRINRSLTIKDSDEFVLHKPNFKEFIQKAQKQRVHLIGLVSEGGVHSHMDHLLHLLNLMKEAGCIEPVIHFISDGRDTPPTSGAEFSRKLLEHLMNTGYGKVVTLSGRFYAMDRDTNMDRTGIAINTIMRGKSVSPLQTSLTGNWKENVVTALEKTYEAAVTDEFIEPVVVDDEYTGAQSDDVFYFFNFRSDRMKQLITEVHKEIPSGNIYTMTQYDKSYTFPIIFSKQETGNTFGDLLAQKNLKQIRVAESEKYPHVTYFFNGGVEIVFEGEVRRVVESNKVRHDQMPLMKADEIAHEVESLVTEEEPHFILVNFANPDMVGHTGNFDAVVQGVERVDADVKKLCEFLVSQGYVCCVTADHGNADIMYDMETHELHTAHTLNPVPFIIYTDDPELKQVVLDQHPANGLHMIAGTMLEIMGLLEPHHEYESLLVR